MDISSLTNIAPVTGLNTPLEGTMFKENENRGFGSILQSAVDLLSETNQLENNAEEAEIQFAMGNSQNTHDLKIAQEKASVATAYVVAVRDKVMEAYREIMNMQM
jgi:flagellar hook-basal body complex protein FliE